MSLNVAAVALGGALGAVLRYGISLWALRTFPESFPWGTLLINGAGCFLIGLLFPHVTDAPTLRLFLLTGVLGGFTTFSTFGLEVVSLIMSHHLKAALAYVSLSLVGGIGLTAAGWGVSALWTR